VCEKVNDLTKRILAKHVGDDHHSWEDNLPAAISRITRQFISVIRRAPFTHYLVGNHICRVMWKYPALEDRSSTKTGQRRVRQKMQPAEPIGMARGIPGAKVH
jgi:hypothetical protein